MTDNMERGTRISYLNFSNKKTNHMEVIGFFVGSGGWI
jgi:hypothetical protein